MVIVELEESEGTENAHPTLILYLSFFLRTIVSNTTLSLFQELNVGIKELWNQIVHYHY